MATVFSNTQSMPACEIFDIVIDGNLVENVRVVSRAYLLEPSGISFSFFFIFAARMFSLQRFVYTCIGASKGFLLLLKS